MNTLDLRAEVFNTLNPYLDDEDVLKSILDYLKSLVSRKSVAKPIEHDTDEEIVENLRQSFKEFKDYKDGKKQLKSADTFLKELEML